MDYFFRDSEFPWEKGYVLVSVVDHIGSNTTVEFLKHIELISTRWGYSDGYVGYHFPDLNDWDEREHFSGVLLHRLDDEITISEADFFDSVRTLGDRFVALHPEAAKAVGDALLKLPNPK